MQTVRSFLVVLILAAFCMAAASYAAQSGGKTITINDDGIRRTIDCRGDQILVTGDRNTLTLRGECSDINVSGDDNVITAIAITNVNVSGDDNKVTVRTTGAISVTGDDNEIKWSKAARGAKPTISNKGSNNSITQYKK